MSCSVDTYLAKAESYLGMKETSPQYKQFLSIYNNYRPLPRGYTAKLTDPWCAIFVSTIAMICEATDIIPPECSAENLETNLRRAGALAIGDIADARRGDVVFYDWNGDIVEDHVGVVSQLKNNVTLVIEGNKNDAVGFRYITKPGIVHTIYRPRWCEPASKSDADYDRVAALVIQGKYGNGVGRESRLLKDGYDPKLVQTKVNKLMAKYAANVYGTRFDSVADDVIKGKYGNGAIRRRNLWAAGYDPDVIQKIVNERMNIGK